MSYVGSIYGPQMGPQLFQSYAAFPSSFISFQSYNTNWGMQPFYQPPPMMQPPIMLPPMIPPLPQQGGGAAQCHGTDVCYTLDEKAAKTEVDALKAKTVTLEAEVAKHEAQIAKLSVSAGLIPPPPINPAEAMTCFKNQSTSGRDFCSPSTVDPIWSGKTDPYVSATSNWFVSGNIYPDLSVQWKITMLATATCDTICQSAGRRLLQTAPCAGCFYLQRKDDGLYYHEYCQGGVSVTTRPADNDPNWVLAHAFNAASPVCPESIVGSASNTMNLTSFTCNMKYLSWDSCGSWSVWK